MKAIDIGALSYDARTTLKKSLSPDEVLNCRFPPAKLELWRKTADAEQVKFVKFVEDAVDAWVAKDKRRYKHDDVEMTRAMMGCRFPSAKLKLWRDVAELDGIRDAALVEAALDARMGRSRK